MVVKKTILLLIFFCFSIIISGTQNPDTITVAYTQAAPFIIEGKDEVKGINFWLWEQVADELNIHYELKKMGFSEMLEALNKGDIDVSINPLTITSERSKGFNFTHSYYASNSTVVVNELGFAGRLKQFLGSFFNENFLRGFFALLLIIFFFGIIVWLFERKVNSEKFRPGWSGMWDGLWWSVVTMTTVGYGDKTPKSKGGKIVALIWMFSGLLFISGLTASVASMLTINQLQSNPEGFNEFKEAAVGCIKNSSTNDFLKERFFTDIHQYTNVTSGLDALNNRDIAAFLYDEPILKYRINQDDKFKHLRLLPIEFDLQLYAFGIAQNRPELEKKISQKILEITEGLEWRIILKEYNLTEI